VEHDAGNKGWGLSIFRDPKNLRYSLRTIIPLIVFLASLLSFAFSPNIVFLKGPPILWVLFISLFSAFCSFLVVTGMTSPLKELLEKAEKMVWLEKKGERGELLEIYELLQRLVEAASKSGYEINRGEVERLDYLIPLGVMASSTAHEIKNPIATIRGLTELLMERLKGEERLYLERIVEAVERADGFLSSLLDLSDREIFPEHFSLKELVIEIVDGLKREFPQVECELLIGNYKILADRTKIYQAITNILRNAFEYEREGGYVKIEGTYHKNGLMISIFNKSSLIDRSDLPHIFKPFFTRKKGGRGLGLYIARRNIRLHGGDIKVKVENGTTFDIFLPLRVEDGKDPHSRG
jgi:signal transduction histidine kinase